MEIVLALMLLGASPFGAAMLDKPTRNRVVRFAQVHNPFRDKDPDVSLALEPRNKDWSADERLAAMWTEAFEYYKIARRDSKLKWALDKRKSYQEMRAKIAPLLDKAEKDVRTAENGGVYISIHDKQTIRDGRATLTRMTNEYYNGLDKDEKFLLGLVDKYGMELYYNQDLIRLAATPELPVFDYGALAVYASK